MDKLPITVIIVAKNAERTIGECLRAIQQNNPAEVVVVDGDSTDRTVELAKAYTERIYSDEGKGLSYARQLGAEQATQEYLAYMDSDVILLSVEALAVMLTDLLNSDFVSVRAIESPDRKFASYWDWGHCQHQIYARRRSRKDYFTTMASLIRKEMIIKYGFDVSEKYLDDYDMGIRLGRDGHTFGTSSAYYHHYPCRTDFKSYGIYEFHLGWLLSRYIEKYGPWHIGFWSPIISLYWIGFFLIKGHLKMIPYLLVDAVLFNMGQAKGLFDLLWKDRKSR
jgi:glycosyltransferase involved in cell wall biosynthesis